MAISENDIKNNKIKPNRIKFEFKLEPSLFRKADLIRLIEIAQEKHSNKSGAEELISKYYNENDVYAVNTEDFYTVNVNVEELENREKIKENNKMSPIYQKPIQFKSS